MQHRVSKHCKGQKELELIQDRSSESCCKAIPESGQEQRPDLGEGMVQSRDPSLVLVHLLAPITEYLSQMTFKEKKVISCCFQRL